MDEHEDDPLAGENAWEEEDVETKAKAMNAASSTHNDSMRTEIMDDGGGGGGVGGHGWLSNDSSRTDVMDSSRTELAEEEDDDDDTPLMRRRSSSGATAGLPASFKVPFLMTLPVSKHDPPTKGVGGRQRSQSMGANMLRPSVMELHGEEASAEEEAKRPLRRRHTLAAPRMVEQPPRALPSNMPPPPEVSDLLVARPVSFSIRRRRQCQTRRRASKGARASGRLPSSKLMVVRRRS